MKMRQLTVVMFLTLAAPLLAAKPAKIPSLPPGDLFFTIKGQPHALERTFPGVTAALMLSDEQKIKLWEAYRQTVASPQLREKGAGLKNNAAATDAEREAVRREFEDARVDLQQQVSTILTPEQKAVVEKIQAAATEALSEARESLQADFAAAKGDKDKAKELNEKVRVEAEDIFAQKLEKILTPAQLQAVQQAATEQRAAEEKARANKLK